MSGNSKNPLYYNKWFKTERHNSCRANGMYSRMIEQMININGITIFYYPISEYDLDGISSLWGEDPQKKYLEKYTLKCLTDSENDQLGFNNFGVSREDSERTIHLSKRQFENITGKTEPQYGDHFLYQQNKIIYEVENFTDNENIVLGEELWWTIFAKPRTVEGEQYGREACDDVREEVIDPESDWGDIKSPCINNDGHIDDDILVDIPDPQPMKVDDKEIVDKEKVNTVLRNSWGGWNA